jgi:hypothetical protein
LKAISFFKEKIACWSFENFSLNSDSFHKKSNKNLTTFSLKNKFSNSATGKEKILFCCSD